MTGSSVELVDPWQKGEFHHDTILRVASYAGELPGLYLVVATNCNVTARSECRAECRVTQPGGGWMPKS